MALPFDFENVDRLLSDDEQELIKVLASFHEHILATESNVASLEARVASLESTLPLAFSTRKEH
jgi:hypothetical protein